MADGGLFMLGMEGNGSAGKGAMATGGTARNPTHSFTSQSIRNLFRALIVSPL
jgi:hypothetical protein